MMPTKTDRTAPGSENDWRLTYSTGSKKWTNDRPGDGKGDPDENEELSDDLTIKRGLKRLEKAVNDYIKGKGDKGIEDAVESLEQHAGTDNAKTVVREVYNIENKEGKDSDSALQDKVVQGLGIAKEHLNRDRKAMEFISYELLSKKVQGRTSINRHIARFIACDIPHRYFHVGLRKKL